MFYKLYDKSLRWNCWPLHTLWHVSLTNVWILGNYFLKLSQTFLTPEKRLDNWSFEKDNSNYCNCLECNCLFTRFQNTTSLENVKTSPWHCHVAKMPKLFCSTFRLHKFSLFNNSQNNVEKLLKNGILSRFWWISLPPLALGMHRGYLV